LQAVVDKRGSIGCRDAQVAPQIGLDGRQIFFVRLHQGIVLTGSGQAKAAGVCPSSPDKESAPRGDFRALFGSSQFALSRFRGESAKPTKTSRKRIQTMETNVAVMTTVAEETKDAKAVEIVEISLSDLDCVGGGSSIGTTY